MPASQFRQHWMLWFSEVYGPLLALFFNTLNRALITTATFSFSVAVLESCHILLHHSEGKEHVVCCINIYIFSPHWLTWDLIGVMMQPMIYPVLCISRTSSLLTPVLSPAGPLCAVMAVFTTSHPA
jgi:hypothetical protein